jgi:hypothetical protein
MTTTYFSDTGIHNILDLTEPLGILKEKFSRANIVKFQKTELPLYCIIYLQQEAY